MNDEMVSGQQISQQLQDYFLTAEAKDIYHVRPSQVAAQLEIAPRNALEALVDAMFVGNAVLHWELECPLCSAFADIPNPFQNPLHDKTCKACGGAFTVHADQEAQVTFSPHATLRALGPEADDKSYRHAQHKHYPPTTVHELMTVQRFRDWAQEEPLPTGQYLEVQQMAVWFSDLTGSTALYARNGDPFAYNLVSQHFDLVTDIVQSTQGAIVKTIGDGIMAVFDNARPGLEAALNANQRLEAFNDTQQLQGDRRLRLKIGIHTGPSIVVKLNERLDYFGTTVNIASRVSNLAKGQEIILTQPAYVQAGIPALVREHPVNTFASIIRGLDQRLDLHRIQLNPQAKPKRKGLLGFLDRLGQKTQVTT